MGEPDEKQDDTTSAGNEDTSKKEPKTFTKEEVAEVERKAKSDALAEVGRYKKSADDAIKAAKAAEDRINKMLREQDDAELEAARDDAEKLNAIRERQKRREAESELDRVQRELNERDEKLKHLEEKEAESTKERNAREIAARLEVDAKRLAKLAKFTDGSPEAIEEIAKELPKKGETKEPLKPDSGKTIGSGEITAEQAKKMSPQEVFDKASEIAKIPLTLGHEE